MAAGKNVTINLTVAELQAFQAFQKVTGAIGKMNQALGQGSGQSQKMGASASASLQKVAQSALRTTQAFLGIHYPLQTLTRLAQTLRNELAQIQRFQLQSAEYQAEVGKYLEAQLQAMPFREKGAPGMDVTETELRDYIIRSQRGVPVTQTIDVMMSTFSAGLALPMSARAALAVMSSQDMFRSLDQESQEAIANAAQSWLYNYGEVTMEELSKMTWGQREDIMRKYMAYVATAVGESRVERAGKYARNLAPFVSLAADKGFELRGAVALAAGSGARAEEPFGRQTGTQMMIGIQQAYETVQARKGDWGFTPKGLDMFRQIAKDKVARDYVLGKLAQEYDLTTKETYDLREMMESGKRLPRGALRSRARMAQTYAEIFSGRGKAWELINIALESLPKTTERAGELFTERREKVEVLPESRAYGVKRGIDQFSQTVKGMPSQRAAGQFQEWLKEYKGVRPMQSTILSAAAMIAAVRGADRTERESYEAFDSLVSGQIESLDRSRYGKETAMAQRGLETGFWPSLTPTDRRKRPMTGDERIMLKGLLDMQDTIRTAIEMIDKERELREKEGGMKVRVTADDSRQTPAEPNVPPIRPLETLDETLY